ncbi:Eukaryotic translation initiation factor 3 subunit E, partial [Zea mays]
MEKYLDGEIKAQKKALSAQGLKSGGIVQQHAYRLFLLKTNAHHLIRYLATAVVVNKRRRNMLKELIKVIQQEHHSYKDPVTECLECLYVNYDFDGAQQKLIECEQ